jgi:Kef-type K+ transport system membrane component KefB
MRIIVQLVAIVGCARLVGALFKRIGQPQVCGEIAAGLVLGPSIFGALWPQAQKMIFDPGAGAQLKVVSEIGLIFIMFLIGMSSTLVPRTRFKPTAFQAVSFQPTC